jgi:prepilin-type N-terminal cleavage/methylation domain-containing protein
MRTNRNGFTLLELLVVVTIVGILAAVAIPNLNGYIRRSRVSEGEAGLAAVRTAMRAKFIENGPTSGYSTIPAGAVDAANIGINAADLDGRFFVTSNYAISSTNKTASTYYINLTGGSGAPKSTLVAGVNRSIDQNGTLYSAHDGGGSQLN